MSIEQGGADFGAMLSLLRESPGMKKMTEANEVAAANGFDEMAIRNIVAGVTTLVSTQPQPEVVRYLQLVLESAVLTRDLGIKFGIKL